MGISDGGIERGWGDDGTPPASAPAAWLRVTAERPRVVVVLSPEPLRYAGHWDPPTKRFRRCGAPETGRCAQCAAAVGRQRRYVVAVQDEAGVQWAWEFGDQQAGPIQALLRDGRPLRGLPLVLSRVPAGAGRPPILVALDADAPPGEADGLPEPADIGAVLWGTWVRQALSDGKAGVPPPARPPPQTPQSPAKPASGSSSSFCAAYERRTGHRPKGF